MTEVGQTVYWLDSNYCIQSGKVVAVNTTLINDRPKQIVVDCAGEFLTFGSASWDTKYWPTPHDAMAEGVARLSDNAKQNAFNNAKLIGSFREYIDKKDPA